MRTLLLAAAAVVLPWMLALNSLAIAQGALPTPSPEQLQLLQNLPPDQRDAIIRQVTGGGAGGLSTGGTGITTNSRDRQTTDPGELERQRAQAEEQQRRIAERQDTDDAPLRNGMPILRGDDSIIVVIDLKRFLPDGQLGPLQPGTNAVGGQTVQGVPGMMIPGANGAGAAAGVAGVPGVAPGAAIGTDYGNVSGNATVAQQRQRTPELTQEETEKRQRFVDLVRARNPYRLNGEGVLQLPGFNGIPLAGLTALEATVRLQADPDLRNYDVNIIRLPLKKIGTEALKPFGYELFGRAPSTFAPVTNVPVPADYVVGAGDQLEVQLYGTQSRILTLEVGRDGRISFPELGPISVGGQRFTSVQQNIESRVAQQMIGTRASVSMRDTRSIRVFVLGEATRPGSYTISGLGTITSALFAAGGVKPIGSLRNIQLKRQGRVIRTFDLYDMLIRGDSTDDVQVLPGDVVFVPPVGATISVAGEVRRPAIYEVKSETSVSDVVALAGGLTSEADRNKASLTRVDEKQQRVVLTVNLTQAAAPAQDLRNGDALQISRLKPTLDSGVVVEGHVFSPATYAYRDGLRLTDVIRSVDELRPNADIGYLLVRREVPPNREISVLSVDLAAALKAPGTSSDILLMPRDRITVFDLETSRERVIRPIMNELRTQSNFGRPAEVVTVEGRVKVPGEYPLEPGMRVSDLIRAGGNLGDSAYGGKAELTRYRVVNGDARRTQQIEIDLAAVIRGDQAANLQLEPFDSLSIKEMPEWSAQGYVTLVGEVRFPGRYSIKQGETLKSVMSRAGGLTEFAFAEGSVFTRWELKEREQKQLDVLADRLQNDLVTLALQGAAANQAQAGTALTVGQSLLTQVRASQAVGRLVIDLPRVMRASPSSGEDIVLRDGDRLIVPKFQQEVTVIGEVQTATSHLYRPELSRDDYIAQSGGVTRRADKDRIYVVRANGSVVAQQDGRWFSRSGLDIRPGDTVVVPLDTERMPALPFWQAVTQIVYNLAISAAAINSF